MNVDILDIEVLRSLQPSNIESLLRFDGWSRAATVQDRMAVYRKRLGDEEAEVVVPLRPDFRDYAQVVHSLLRTLSKYEAVGQLDLVSRVQNINADVIKVRVAHDSFEDGTIPLDAGTHLIERARGLMLSAAWAAYAPRAILSKRAPKEVENFLRNVRLGQTERGSYIVTMKTTVPATFTDVNGQASLYAEEDEPFERQATKALSRALRTIQESIADFSSTGSVRAFEQAVEKGVSANLLESLEGIFEQTGAQAAEIDFDWSAMREVVEPLPRSVLFEPKDRDVLRRASAYIRWISPDPTYKLEGFVHEIKRTAKDAPRLIYVRALVNGRSRLVRVELTPEQYEQALQAQGDWKAVQALGELVKVNQTYELRNPTDFEIFVSEDGSEEPVEAFEAPTVQGGLSLVHETRAVYDAPHQLKNQE